MMEQQRQSFVDGAAMEQMAQFFKVLGDTTRVKLLLRLAESEQCVSQLAEGLGLSESAVSHHLRLLRLNRMTKCRRCGKSIYYALSDEHVRSALILVEEHILERQSSK